MTRAPSLCIEVGCGELCESGRGRCPEHEAANKAKRAKRQKEVRGTQSSGVDHGPYWRKIRGSYIKRHPVCEEPGCKEAAVDVHHVDELGGNKDANLEALCKSHHSRKTAVLQPAGWNLRRRVGAA